MFIFEFENTQNSFSCGLSFGPFWSVKYLNFGQELPIWTAHHIFWKVETLRLLKIHVMFCSLRDAKKRYHLMDYRPLWVWQSDAAPFCENYSKLYFDTKNFEKELNGKRWNFWCPLFKKVLFLANFGHCLNFLD